MPPITITRALSELKTIKARIEKLRNRTTFISTIKTGQSWRDHREETKNNWQAIGDLSKRHQRLKFAIIDSNNKTNVTICGTTYTISQALAHREWLENTHNEILTSLRTQRQAVSDAVEKHDKQISRNLQTMLEKSFGSATETASEQVEAVSKTFRDSNRIEVVDPLQLNEIIELMTEKSTAFLDEIDFALSESNAITMIDI